jgi:hypothetical protein
MSNVLGSVCMIGKTPAGRAALKNFVKIFIENQLLAKA